MCEVGAVLLLRRFLLADPEDFFMNLQSVREALVAVDEKDWAIIAFLRKWHEFCFQVSS